MITQQFAKFKFILLILGIILLVNNVIKSAHFDNSMNILKGQHIKSVPAELSTLSPLFTNVHVINKRACIFKHAYESFFTKKSSAVVQTKIPKIIHHIWLGSKLPDNFKFCLKSCKKHHPDWEHRLWTDVDLKKYDWRFKDILLSKNVNPGKKSDILRLEILFKYGGVYLDTDFFCCKPLDKLHEKVDFYACIIDQSFTLANGVIGCTANNKLIGQCLDKLRPNNNNNPNDIMLSTGPYFLTEQVIKYIDDYSATNIVLLPINYFFPMPSSYRFNFWNGTINLNFVKQFEKSETLAIHLWATSWQNKSNSKQNILYNILKKHDLLFIDSHDIEKLIQARRLTDQATPLIIAAQANLLQVVDLLGRNGADFNVKDKYGHTALYYAKTKKQLKLIKLIEAYS